MANRSQSRSISHLLSEYDMDFLQLMFRTFMRQDPKSWYFTQGDLQGAKEYYMRAITTDPGDGKILEQYAQLVWELHYDSKKALSYFERAVEATPEDSYVLGAYAHFLRENEDDRLL